MRLFKYLILLINLVIFPSYNFLGKTLFLC